jgi:hypothetical protein
MKLNEIKQVNAGEYDLKEGVIPVHITMALEHVIRDGKVTNPVQHFIMAGLAAMFKNGGPSRWPRDLNEYGMTTNAELIESVKKLSDTESVNLASWLYNELQAPATFESNPYTYANPQMHMLDWVRWVLKKQA